MDHIRLSPAGDGLIILDQSRLPGKAEYLELTTLAEMTEAIQSLRVRGAPALGIFGGFGLYVLAMRTWDRDFYESISRDARVLANARPTAVNLSRGVNRVLAAGLEGPNPARSRESMLREARAILDEDIATCRAISEQGLTLLRDGQCVLTHCNAGPLATSKYGTAIGPLILGAERGMHLRAIADETRPLLQGARLTSYELCRAGVDVTLICDSMAAWAMAQGMVDICFVGCDRVARNGDTANKIGTSAVAILAKHYGIPFYVLGPTSTLDLSCPDGEHIPIELRDPEEIRSAWYREPMAPEGVRCWNPAFDVTPHDLITGIITERGIARPPFEKSLPAL
ncbi:MAG: S-methyl-5-thioribose-1-phosphate isomerase [Oscillospiraceae bacterium]|nr:S-methyl-5-thioribose-1-phosphate isomerase [Oscillospiraceae bacterium]